MKDILKSLWEHKFIAATGVSALIHSTWTLGTLFSGEQPSGLQLVGWLIPAFLIAFALDMGQIATSAEIRHNGLTKSRALTFVVFALATYYCQWIYMAHHMPALAIAAGVSEVHRQLAVSMRDLALWVIPAFLPISTVLYTFSNKKIETPAVQDVPQIEIKPVEVAQKPDALPFGITAPELVADVSTKTTPKSRKRTVIASSTNGHRSEKALRNKEMEE